MGATTFRRRLERRGLTIDTLNVRYRNVPDDADIIVTHAN